MYQQWERKEEGGSEGCREAEGVRERERDCHHVLMFVSMDNVGHVKRLTET